MMFKQSTNSIHICTPAQMRLRNTPVQLEVYVS